MDPIGLTDRRRFSNSAGGRIAAQRMSAQRPELPFFADAEDSQEEDDGGSDNETDGTASEDEELASMSSRSDNDDADAEDDDSHVGDCSDVDDEADDTDSLEEPANMTGRARRKPSAKQPREEPVDPDPILAAALLNQRAISRALREELRKRQAETAAPPNSSDAASAVVVNEDAAVASSSTSMVAQLKCVVITFKDGKAVRCAKPCATKPGATKHHAVSLRGTWELAAVSAKNAELQYLDVCLAHFNSDNNLLKTYANPGPPPQLRNIQCRGCQRWCCVLCPEDGGGNETGWLFLTKGANPSEDTYLRVPSLASRCNSIKGLLATPPRLVNVRKVAGFICVECLRAVGTHISSVGEGQGKSEHCYHTPKTFATASDLVNAAKEAASASAPSAVGASGAVFGTALLNHVTAWWGAMGDEQRTAFKSTYDPPVVLDFLPPALRTFLEAFASGDQARAREAARKASARGTDDPAKRADAEQRRLTLVQGRLAMIGSLLCSLAVPSCEPGIFEALCRLQAKEKWHREVGIVLRMMGVVSRLPASERVRERRRESGPSPIQRGPSVTARLAAGGAVAAAIDNVDFANETNGSGDAYSNARKSHHLTSCVAFLYASPEDAHSVSSTLSKGLPAPVASKKAAASAAPPSAGAGPISPTLGSAGPGSPALGGVASGAGELSRTTPEASPFGAAGFGAPGLGGVGGDVPALGSAGRGVRPAGRAGRGVFLLGSTGSGAPALGSAGPPALGSAGPEAPGLGGATLGAPATDLVGSEALALGGVGVAVDVPVLDRVGFGVPALRGAGRGVRPTGSAGRGVPLSAGAWRGAPVLARAGRGVHASAGPGLGVHALSTDERGMSTPDTAGFATPTAAGAGVAAPSLDHGGLAVHNLSSAAPSAGPAAARAHLSAAASISPVATAAPFSVGAPTTSSTAMDGVTPSAPTTRAETHDVTSSRMDGVIQTEPSPAAASSAPESSPSPLARSCTTLPERSAPSAAWFAPGAALAKAEGILASMVPKLLSDGISDNSVDQVTQAVAAMSDRRGDELVAEILILPTSTRAATTNRGIMDALDYAKDVLPLDQGSMQVTGDQSCYVRIAEVQTTSKDEYEWAVAYPGTCRTAIDRMRLGPARLQHNILLVQKPPTCTPLGIHLPDHMFDWAVGWGDQPGFLHFVWIISRGVVKALSGFGILQLALALGSTYLDKLERLSNFRAGMRVIRHLYVALLVAVPDAPAPSQPVAAAGNREQELEILRFMRTILGRLVVLHRAGRSGNSSLFFDALCALAPFFPATGSNLYTRLAARFIYEVRGAGSTSKTREHLQNQPGARLRVNAPVEYTDELLEEANRFMKASTEKRHMRTTEELAQHLTHVQAEHRWVSDFVATIGGSRVDRDGPPGTKLRGTDLRALVKMIVEVINSPGLPSQSPLFATTAFLGDPTFRLQLLAAHKKGADRMVSAINQFAGFEPENTTGARTVDIPIAPSVASMMRRRKPKDTDADRIRAALSRSLEVAMRQIESSNKSAEERKVMLREVLDALKDFPPTLAGLGGEKLAADKASTMDVVAEWAGPTVESDLHLLIHAFDGLQFVMKEAAVSAKRTLRAIAQRLVQAMLRCLPKEAIEAFFCYDRLSLVPEAKTSTQKARSAAVANIDGAAQRRMAAVIGRGVKLTPETVIDTAWLAADRQFRQACVRVIAEELLNYPWPQRLTVTVDSELESDHAAPPVTVERGVRRPRPEWAHSFGEADAAMWHFLRVRGQGGVAHTADADATEYGL